MLLVLVAYIVDNLIICLIANRYFKSLPSVFWQLRPFLIVGRKPKTENRFSVFVPVFCILIDRFWLKTENRFTANANTAGNLGRFTAVIAFGRKSIFGFRFSADYKDRPDGAELCSNSENDNEKLVGIWSSSTIFHSTHPTPCLSRCTDHCTDFSAIFTERDGLAVQRPTLRALKLGRVVLPHSLPG